MKGIVLAGGSGMRLYPLTQVVSKQLMPIYDKPMIYYPIATLMQAGIKEILIISTPADLPRFQALLGNGKQWGLSFAYEVQATPDGLAQALIIAKSFLSGSPVTLILGDNVFYGQTLPQLLKQAKNQSLGCTVFGYHVSNPQRYGVIEFDNAGRAISIEEKPQKPKSNFAIPGIYFFDENAVGIAENVTPSARGELEITDVINHYLKKEQLNVINLGRGVAWLDTGTHDDLLAAAQFIATIDKRQGLKINCPEEIAWRSKWISTKELAEIAKPLQKSGYGEYLLKLISEQNF
ncbi:glucose-1-phosphate thymidylyltransferase RfbA [Psychrosphaera aquimarina]|uniref:Glucose-1-phosphate thymidylyltransferase n=1 Tax=Psychrosphaera aquimarina TaxID=2044854 RepID=A0ABU3R4L4_9GAMM|nr:glucose-1-phosphate thymidylyltransferase RfbA [Psychrosphaera aquimarina]MDU0114588.1 glucose-1-phosphate thymidylyltransferase RfbA [Psychrosphaera aquimarina]